MIQNTIEIALKGNVDNASPWVQTWGHALGFADGPDFQTEFNFWLTEWKSAFQSLLGDTLQLTSALITGWGDDGTPGTFEPTMTAFECDGTGTGTQLPPSDCMVVTLRSVGPGRSGRGRKYFSPLFSGDMSHVPGYGPAWDTGLTANWQTATVDFIEALIAHTEASDSGIDLYPVVISRTDELTYQITGALARRYIGSQRRRDSPPRFATP